MINVLTGARYKSITRETAGVLRAKRRHPGTGQRRGCSCGCSRANRRSPAARDLLEPRLDKLAEELRALARKNRSPSHPGGRDRRADLRPVSQIGPTSWNTGAMPRLNQRRRRLLRGRRRRCDSARSSGDGRQQCRRLHREVNGQSYVVEVAAGGDVSGISPVPAAASTAQATAAPVPAAHPLAAPLAGNIFHVNVIVGDEVEAGDVIVVLGR